MADEQTQEKPKKRSKLKIIILLIILLLVITGGIICYWWLNLRVPEKINDDTQTAAEQIQSETAAAEGENKEKSNEQKTDAGPAPSKTLLNIVSIPTVTINLADKDTIRYLKVGFDVELSTKDSAQALDEQKARIRDSIIILLSSKTYADLASTEGKLKVKNEIATRLNQILGVPRVVQIYFNEFVIN